MVCENVRGVGGNGLDGGRRQAWDVHQRAVDVIVGDRFALRDQEIDSDSDGFNESDSDTGGSSDQEVDTDTDDVGGNTTSDSVSTSETDSPSSSETDGGSEQSSSTLNLAYGPGGLVTGGSQTDGETGTESTSDTSTDSSNESSNESETDSEIEAADNSTDTISSTENDNDSDDESGTDNSSSGGGDTTSLGAVMDVLSGGSSSSESDTGTDSDVNADTMTTTENESSSYSETVGGETTTDSELDTSTETDTVTDTDDDTPTNTEASSQSTGAAGIILSVSTSDSVNDTGSTGESDDDTDVDTSTETLSQWDSSDTTSTLNESDISTVTESDSLNDSESDNDTLTEVDTQSVGVAGEITGGTAQSIETGSGSGSGSTTASGQDTTTEVTTSDEQDTEDSSTASESQKESGSYTSTGTDSDGSTLSESTTETLDVGGAVSGGSVSESSSESSGANDGSTETDGMSETDVGDSSDFDGPDDDSATGAGSETTYGQYSSSSTLIDNLAEVLDADGVVSSGGESDSLQDSSGTTTTVSDQPTQTVADAVLAATMTLTDTNTETDTSNESDGDWATETLGESATIAGGSDCFTVSESDSSVYNDTGSGPESYNDTSSSPADTATVNNSGSSSDLVYQTFGDALGTGGAISSGSLSYTDSTSEVDDEAADQVGAGTVSYAIGSTVGTYGIDTGMSDADSDYETGTESLGGGGTIAGGTASFLWSETSAVGQCLRFTVSLPGLNVQESSTDAEGFAESGTESMTAGGADLPGTASFDWTQMGTDSYLQTEAALENVATISDTVSASWSDDGTDSLTAGDSLVAQTDSYDFASVNSEGWGASGTEIDDVGYSSTSTGAATVVYSSWSGECVSDGDAGYDTLSADASDSGSLTLASATASYTIAGSADDGETDGVGWYFQTYLEAEGDANFTGEDSGSDGDYAEWAGTGTVSDLGTHSINSVSLSGSGSGSSGGGRSLTETGTGLVPPMTGSGGGGGSDGNQYELVSINDSALGYQTSAEVSGELDTSGSATMGGTGWGGEEGNGGSSYSSYSDASSVTYDGAYGYTDIGASQVNLDDDDGAYEVVQDEPEVFTFIYSSASGLTETSSGEAPTTIGAPVTDDLFGQFPEVPLDPLVDPFGPGTGDLGPADAVPTFGPLFYPDTNRMVGTANDGVSRSDPPAPTATLVALAAAGRNPADITIPTIGSEGSGGGGEDDDAIAGGPSSGSTGGSSPAADSAASENGSGTEVAWAGGSSGGAGSSTSASTAASGSSGGSSSASEPAASQSGSGTRVGLGGDSSVRLDLPGRDRRYVELCHSTFGGLQFKREWCEFRDLRRRGGGLFRRGEFLHWHGHRECGLRKRGGCHRRR